MTKRTYFKNRLMVDENRIVCWSVNKSAPKHFVKRYRHVRRRFNPA